MPPSLHPAHPSGWPSCSARPNNGGCGAQLEADDRGDHARPNNGGCGPGRAAAALRNWYDAGPGEDPLPVRQGVEELIGWLSAVEDARPAAKTRSQAPRE